MNEPDPQVEARRRDTVARARRRLRAPAAALIVLGVLQMVGGVGVAIVGELAGSFFVFAAGVAWCGPGALLLGAGTTLTRLRGWNLAFPGLLFTIAMCLAVAGACALAGLPYAWAPLIPILAALALLVWNARLEEDPEIRAARNLVHPPKARDPVDFQRL